MEAVSLVCSFRGRGCPLFCLFGVVFLFWFLFCFSVFYLLFCLLTAMVWDGMIGGVGPLDGSPPLRFGDG